MTKTSAGILFFRFNQKKPEVLLVHPGGPFWKNKDDGAWAIPKGEVNPGEELLETAVREVTEELGITFKGKFIALTPLKQKGGKMVYVWGMQHDFDAENITSNSFTIEWPPHSGKQQSFPEVDRAQWFDLKKAKKKILASQLPFLEELSVKVL